MKMMALTSLWEICRRCGVKPLVLRDFEQLPHFAGSDLDLSIRQPSDIPLLERAVILFAQETGAEIIVRTRRSYVWHFRLLHQERRERMDIDIHTEEEGWRGPLLLTADELFAEATEREGWFEPALHHQAAIAFFQHLLWGAIYKKKYQDLLPCWVDQCEADFRRTVVNAFGAEWSQPLVEMIHARDVDGIKRAAQPLRRALWRTRGLPDLPASLHRLGRFLVLETLFNLSRHGRWVVLIGPDGVGKTSVAAGVPSEVGRFFRNFRYHHWIPRWDRPLASEVPPGGGRFQSSPPRRDLFGRIGSLFRLGRNLLRAWLAYLTRIYPRMIRQELILGDRYLFNYVLDPDSVRYTASPRWVRLALKLAPRPDLVISLTADPDTIHARKNELIPEEITERLERARSLRELGFRVVEISAEAPLEEVVSDAAIATIHTLR